jgi:NitT/TauT family transport system substrate-binding protein
MLVIGLLVGLLGGCAAGGAAPRAAAPPPAAVPSGASASQPASPAPAAASAAPLTPPVPVKIADIPNGSNAGVYIALDRGYFQEAGLDVTLETFDVSEKAIPAIATNQVDVGAGGVNAALFSAVARGLPLRIVGGISGNEPGYSSSALMVRKDLIDSGRVRDYADLRGMRFGLTSVAGALGVELHKIQEYGGLTDADLDIKLLSFPDATVALSNGGIEAALLTEPFVVRLVQSGSAVRWKGADEIYPHHQLTVLLYSPEFPQRHPEAAIRFMEAYIRGARDYVTTMKGGGDRTPVFQILVDHTPIKDIAVYAAMMPSGVDANAGLNVASLQGDQDLWVSQGHIPQPADLNTAIDLQYQQAALQRLDARRP